MNKTFEQIWNDWKAQHDSRNLPRVFDIFHMEERLLQNRQKYPADCDWVPTDNTAIYNEWLKDLYIKLPSPKAVFKTINSNNNKAKAETAHNEAAAIVEQQRLADLNLQLEMKEGKGKN